MMYKYTIQQFIRWFKMFAGKSNLHMAQPIGLGMHSKDFRYYHNDLSSKLLWKGYPDERGIKRNKLADGSLFYFPIALAQRGLALHDFLLSEVNEGYYKELVLISNWFVENQDVNGGWDCWSKSKKGTISNYSAMAQGQVVSLLVRVKMVLKLDILGVEECIDKALNLMFQEPLVRRFDRHLFFDETPVESKSIILNGHIFSMWGVLDYINFYNNESMALEHLQLSFEGLLILLSKLDRGYWSDYDSSGRICSPFYHNLHLAQLEALIIQFDSNTILEYKDRWDGYKENRNRAIFVKVFQKLIEKKFNEFVS